MTEGLDRDRLRRWMPAAPARRFGLCAAALIFVVSGYFANFQYGFSFRLKSASPDVARLQYDIGNGYQPKYSRAFLTWGGGEAETLHAHVPGGALGLRLVLPAGAVTLEWIELREGRSHQRWSAGSGFAGWAPAPGVTQHATAAGLELFVSGDGTVTLATLPALARRLDLGWPLAWAALAFAVAALLASAWPRARPRLAAALATPERVLLVVGVPFGAALALALAPFQMPDENSHFIRVYGITQGHLLSERKGDALITTMPPDVEQATGEFMDVKANAQRKVHPSRLWQALRRPRSGAPAHAVPNGAAAYAPVAYLGPALGVGLGRLLPVAALLQLYLGRLGNLAVSLAAIWLAVTILPFWKRTFVLLALMPMNLSELATVSGDGTLVAAAFLLYALVLSVAFGGRALDGRVILALALLSALIALCKPNYLLLDLLLLAIPAARAGGRARRAVVFTLMCGAGWAARLGWSWWSTPPAVGSAVESPASRQLTLMLRDPIGFLAVFWRTLADGYTIPGTFVGLFGWLETPLPQPLISLFVCALVVTALSEPAPALAGWQRLLLAATFALGLLSIGAAMYLYFTAYYNFDFNIILGLQGRYYIPFAPALLIGLQNRWLRLDASDGKASAALATFTAAALSISLYVIIDRFYLPQ